MKRKVLTVVLCMSITLGTVLETGVSVRAAGNQNVPVDKVSAETGTTEGAVTENETDNKENGAVTDKVETEEAEKDGETPQETPEETPETTVPDNTTPQEEPEGTAPEVTEPGAGTPAETPKQPEVQMMAEENTGEKWWMKKEAESGILGGKAKPEQPDNVAEDLTLVSNLDGGEEAASVTIKVKANFSGEAQMKVRYRSGNNRDLCYRVNGGDVEKWENLNSGDWNIMAETEEKTISLKEGENEIKFFASEGKDGPGLDYVIFSRNGGTEEDRPGKEEMVVTFQAENETLKTFNKKRTETIDASEVPEPEVPEGKDFLGWFWGDGAKYEGMFPLNLTEVPPNVLDDLAGDLTFTARFGTHTPANPKEKEGYRLIFDDEFDGESLNETNWVDRYLSSWSTTFQETQGRTFDPENGIMSLQITEETNPWCLEFDEQTVISGFTTGQRNGLHNWTGKNAVRNPEDTQLTHINQYGYYEMRMKGQTGSSRHSAWWLLGFEDVPEESAEIDIFEVKGQNDHGVPPALHGWKDTDAFPSGGLPEYTNWDKDFNNEYHVYGFDWQQGTSGNAQYPDKIVLYIDGEQVGEKNVNIDYPMIQLLSLYEKRAGGWTGAWEWVPYPNTMDVDYVRVYKKLPAESAAQSNPTIKEVKAENLYIDESAVALQQYQTENGTYTEKNLPGTKSYVRVKWSDGVETQEAVVWDEITQQDIEQLKTGNSIVKNGTVKVNSIPGNPFTVETAMAVTPVPDSIGASNFKKLFDGNIDGNATSTEIRVTQQDIDAGNVVIPYNFAKDVLLSGIDMWTNYGQDQGIKSFNLEVWDEEANDWSLIKDTNGQAKLFELNWEQTEDVQDKQSVTFDPVTTNKVKIIVKDAGLRWNKIAMREIAFAAEDIALDTLEIVTPPTKTVYKEGEDLDLTGMTLKGIYNNKKEEEISINDVTVTGYDSSKVGKQTVKVTLKSNEEITTTFEVEVLKRLVGMNMVPAIQAKDIELMVGDEFDDEIALKGVTAKDREDGDLTGSIKVKENTVDTSKAGEYKVVYTVTDSQGATATKTIKVTVKQGLTELNVVPTIHANDIELKVGDKFDDKAALKDVTAKDKEDGDLTKNIKVKENTVDTSKAGEYKVVYTVTDSQGATATKTVKVTVKAKDTEKPEVVLESLTITLPAKTEYVEGEELNLEGMKVTGNYSDGTTKDIPLEDVIVTGYDSSKVGKQTITVTHKSSDKLIATFEVEVKKGLAGVNKAPSIEAKDVVLTVGDKFDPLKGVKASDAEDGDLTKDIKVEENTVNTSKAGVYKVVYKVTDKDGAIARKTIKVTVKAKDTGKDNDKDNDKDTSKTNNKSVKTADTMDLGLWGMLILLSGSVVTVLFRKRTKR